MFIEYDKQKKEEEYLISLIKEKNMAVNEYNRMIHESQTAYDKVIWTILLTNPPPQIMIPDYTLHHLSIPTCA